MEGSTRLSGRSIRRDQSRAPGEECRARAAAKIKESPALSLGGRGFNYLGVRLHHESYAQGVGG
jgi:hypothetical protein